MIRIDPAYKIFKHGQVTELFLSCVNPHLQPIDRTLASLLSDQTTVTEYIYCIKLPQFVCKSQATEENQVQYRRQARLQRYAPYLRSRHQIGSTCSVGLRQAAASHRCNIGTSIDIYGTSDNTAPTQVNLAKLFQPQQTLYEVVKIGKTKNPAQRFHDILGPFQNLPEVQVPLLQEINSTDDPQTVLRKVKSTTCNPVIFLVKVRDIGTAEGDIREAYGVPLGQEFIDKFLASVSNEQQKKNFKDDSGMTEWVVMDAKFAAHLQTTFHLQHCPFVNTLWPCGKTPSGEQVRRQLFSQHQTYFSSRRRSVSFPPEFDISFPPTNFSCTLYTLKPSRCTAVWRVGHSPYNYYTFAKTVIVACTIS